MTSRFYERMTRSATLALVAAMFALAACSPLASAGSPAETVDPAETGKLPPPEATTTGAESLEATDEELNGVINPRGVPAVYQFQLGATNSYGRIITGERGTFNGHKPYKVGAVAFELRPGITYHYRIVAISEGGKTYGADKTFTTFYKAATPRSVIACFHKKIRRFTAEPRPEHCDIAGYRGRKKEFVANPIKGMKWGHWGFNPARAAFGVDVRNGTHVRVIAYRPITCDNGRTWYSEVVIVNPGNGNFFGLRLPTCNGPSVIG
jgi:hypothetical protein